MHQAQRIADISVAIVLALILVSVTLRQESFVLLAPISKEESLTIITTLEPAISAAIASISGMMIAAYLIASQLSGRRPYSRFVASFHSNSDLVLFAILFVALTWSILTQAFASHIAEDTHLYWLVDVSVALFVASILSLVTLMLKHLSIFDPRLVVEMALAKYNIRSVHQYGLVEVVPNLDSSETALRLRTWGHRHNLSDPLGPFHDIVREAIDQKERITLQLYLSALTKTVARLDGVPFERRFALAKGSETDFFKSLKVRVRSILLLPICRDLSLRIEVTVHALHYLVRLARKMIEEWELDNHRQIFIINIADLILCLSKRSDSEILIELCIDAITRISLDYKEVKPFGSYEPLHELFFVAEELRHSRLYRSANECIGALAFLDLHTKYISESTLVAFPVTLARLSPESIAFFEKQKVELVGKSLSEAFPRTVWRDGLG